MKALDRVTLNSMRFHALVGVLPHEAQVAQPVEVDLTVEVDESVVPPNVLDYAKLYESVAGVMRHSHIHYLEDAAERIATAVLDREDVRVAHVSVRKLHVALPGQLGYAEVSITRPRGG